METDEFERPAGFNRELDCDKLKRINTRRDNYFRDKY
jgi:hypothetical protein